MYMSYITIHTHDPKIIGRRSTRIYPHVQRNIKHTVRKNNAQERQSAKATVMGKPRQDKMVQKLTKSQQLMKQVKPSNFTAKFSKPITSINYKNKQSNIVVSEDHSQLTSRPPLFITDQPVAIMGINFWMEAGRTRTDEEKQLSEMGFSRHAFNQYASDRLGYFRDIPDTRHTL